MKDLGPVQGIQLTRIQEMLMSQVADSLISGDHGAAEESWKQLIQSMMSTRKLGENDVNALIEHTMSVTGLEEKLAAAGNDVQLANIELQNALQKQQQLVQLISNVSKILNDTAMAVIRKIGG
ncbi:MAG: hypothetical protein BWY63_02598 [Chloroflexi bacterium ADurb.Bin360]|nr:MAG: hypothetical protein BWY63_02598 [Chloroflexi bacterium ADurb.Bin360]